MVKEIEPLEWVLAEFTANGIGLVFDRPVHCLLDVGELGPSLVRLQAASSRDPARVRLRFLVITDDLIIVADIHGDVVFGAVLLCWANRSGVKLVIRFRRGVDECVAHRKCTCARIGPSGVTC